MSELAQPEVDAAVAQLDALDDLPVAEHVHVYDSAHDLLRKALTDTGDAEPA